MYSFHSLEGVQFYRSSNCGEGCTNQRLSYIEVLLLRVSSQKYLMTNRPLVIVAPGVGLSAVDDFSNPINIA